MLYYLFFFKDGTFGCTEEQKAFQKVKEELNKYNAVILGVSRDNVETHKSTIQEHKLTYALLADTDGTITKAYGAIDNERVSRSTFIISPEGKVAAAWARVFGFDKHPQEVVRKLEEIVTGKSSDDHPKKTSADEEDDDNDDNQAKEDDEDNDDDANNEDDGNNEEEDDDANDDDE